MRRFLQTRTGKAICHILAVALILPFIGYVSSRRADAQIQVKPQWAVVPFVNGQPGNGGQEYGNLAAQKVYDELAKTQQYDLIPLDSVQRSIETLGLTTPVTDATSLLRLAQDLNVTTLVTGKMVGWTVRNVSGGKQADVGIQVTVRDVSSGLPVNGAAIEATSSVRSSSVSQDAIVQEALEQASAQAVSKIQSQILPNATVLNTRNNEGLINRGARDGFRDGQTVIVTRAREEVATASIFGTEPDSANIRVIRQFKGIQPGDKVRVVFAVPDLTMAQGRRGGEEHFVTHNPPERINSAAVISAGLVLGAVAFLLSGGRSNSNNSVDNVKAEATTFPTTSGNPVIRISWRLDVFYRNSNNVQWLIYRNDMGNTPVQVQDGSQGAVFDDTTPKSFSAAISQPSINSLTCAGLGSVAVTAPGIVVGQPYVYQVAGVYQVLQIDLPGQTTGGTGGTGGTTVGGTGGGTAGGTGGVTAGGGGTAGTTGTTVAMERPNVLARPSFRRPQGTTTGTTATTTGTTATTTGTTATITTGGSFCYFVSAKTTAQGYATALGRATLTSPTQGANVVQYAPFTFSSLETTNAPIVIAYVVQISSNPLFPKAATITSGELVTSDQNALSINFQPRFTGDTLQQFLIDHFGSGVTTIWWRVGARNVADNPGPYPDPTTGLRYIFSPGTYFQIPGSSTPPKGRHGKVVTKAVNTVKTSVTKGSSKVSPSLPSNHHGK